MPKSFLVSADFNWLETLRVRLQNLSAAPSNPQDGWIYYDTTLDRMGVYQGGSWAYVGDELNEQEVQNIVGMFLADGDHTTGVSFVHDTESDVLNLTIDFPVDSVNGQTGAVTLGAGDVGAIATTARGAANGVASLGADGTIPDGQIPAGVARDSEVASAISAIDFPVDSVNGQTGAVSLSAANVGAIATTARGVAGGVATLDEDATIPAAQIPATIARDTEVTAAIDAITAADVGADPAGTAAAAVAAIDFPVDSVNGQTGVVELDAGDVGADPAGTAAGLVAAIDFPVDSVNGNTGAVTLGAADVGAIPTTARGAANGVASLGADGLVPDGQLPAGIARDSEVSSAISTAIGAIDYPVDSVNGATGAVTLDAGDVGAVPTTAVGAANGVASLDSGGKVPSSQLPNIALTDVNVVADIAARDALTVEEGDVAIVTSEATTYIYDGTTWIEIDSPTDGVTAVTAGTGLESTGGTTPEISIADGGVDTDQIADGAVTAAKLDTAYVRKFSANVGGGTAVTLTHGLGTYDVNVSVFTNGGVRDDVIVDVERPSINTVTLRFAVAPAADAYRAVVTG